MPDITMCANVECAARHTCYRYRAKADRWQSYSYFSAAESKHRRIEGACSAHLNILEGDVVEPTEVKDSIVTRNKAAQSTEETK